MDIFVYLPQSRGFFGWYFRVCVGNFSLNNAINAFFSWMVVPELPLPSSISIFLGHKSAHKKKVTYEEHCFPTYKQIKCNKELIRWRSV